jgi:hypothetical protein
MSSDLVFVKYCPLCNAENPRQQAFCVHCHDGDLSTVPVELKHEDPTTTPPARALGTAATDSAICTLELLDDPAFVYTIHAGQSVGRTDAADVVLAGVPKLDWISGAHARFTRRGTQWFVQHVATTNFIKVDGETFKGREEVAIHDGSVLVLSLTAFRVRLQG